MHRINDTWCHLSCVAVAGPHVAAATARSARRQLSPRHQRHTAAQVAAATSTAATSASVSSAPATSATSAASGGGCHLHRRHVSQQQLRLCHRRSQRCVSARGLGGRGHLLQSQHQRLPSLLQVQPDQVGAAGVPVGLCAGVGEGWVGAETWPWRPCWPVCMCNELGGAAAL